MLDHIAETGKKPRRQAAKSTARPVAASIKTAVSLSPDTMRRLVIHAAMSGQTQSQLVAELIEAHCRRYVVQDRVKAAVASFDDQATDMVSTAA